MSQNLETLLTVAAELRAAGHSWDGVAARVHRQPATCRRWPARHPDRWEATYRAAQLRRFDEIHNEAASHLQGLLRDPDPKVKTEAVKLWMRAVPAAVARHRELVGAMPAAEKDTRGFISLEEYHAHEREQLNIWRAEAGLDIVSRRRPDEAAAMYQEAIEMSRRLTEGRGDFGTAAYLYNLALLHEAGHRLDAAEKAMREALELQRRTQPGHPFVVRTLASLAFVLEAEGKSKEALPVLHEALASYRRLVADYSTTRPEGGVLNLAAAHPIDLGNIFATARSLKLPPTDVYQEVWPAKAVLSQAFERRHLLARAGAVDPKASAALKARTEARRRRADLLPAPALRTTTSARPATPTWTS
jgi:tetratricopeptide (TPR) repeat protein